MFLSQDQIQIAIEKLGSVHPFFGISFLVFKELNLPIGETTEFQSKKVKEFLERYYKPDTNSSFFFRSFRVSEKQKFWLKSDYHSSGLQAVVTQTFGQAFLHPENTDIWGWQNDYVMKLQAKLTNEQKIPSFYLAVWLYREEEWSAGSIPTDILDKFQKQFKLTDVEVENLFDMSVPSSVTEEDLFSDNKSSWIELTNVLAIPPPPDAPQDEGGTLSLLTLRGVGPAKILNLEFSERTNLLTGDNGLGKSFILESAWSALSGNWDDFRAYPRTDASRNEPEIAFQIAGKSGKKNLLSSKYDWEKQGWKAPRKRSTIPGLLIYARVDGAFAVWDPARDYESPSSKTSQPNSKPIVFAREEVWNGLSVSIGGKTSYVSNGLITDWINWQNSPNQEAFDTLKNVLMRLSPPSLDRGDLGKLEPGQPRRIPDDSRLIPTIKHSYGEVPLIYASAGVRRIVALAYLIVWAWEEHKTQSQLIRKDPQRRMVILVDEIEAHLHPQWQRTILPALLDVWKDLNSDVQIQMIIATHSPLVMASIEPSFNLEKDRIFHIDLVQQDLLGTEVSVNSLDFVRYGTVDSWLKSDIFELGQARSIEAEKAIEDAKKLQVQNKVSSEDVAEVSQRLLKYLSAHDEFWPRWTYFAEQYGVNL